MNSKEDTAPNVFNCFLIAPAVSMVGLFGLTFVERFFNYAESAALSSILPAAGIGLFVAIIGLLVAYASMLIIGVPLYWIFSKTGLVDWSYALLGGVLCALPTVCLISAGDVPGAYYSEQIVVFSALGMFGGMVFWYLAARPLVKTGLRSNYALFGRAGAAIVIGGLSYISVAGGTEYLMGNLDGNQGNFENSKGRFVSVTLKSGNTVSAFLKSGTPFIANCEVSVVKRRDLSNLDWEYDVSHYQDFPLANRYKYLSGADKDSIPAACGGVTRKINKNN